MSEFSDSLHLRATDTSDGIGLLRAAKVAGFVFPAASRWVSVAYSSGTRPDDSEHVERLIAANKGLMIHYVHAQDHGTWVDVYEGASRVARLKALFESQNARFDRDAFMALGLLTSPDADAIEQWVAGAHQPKQRRREDEHLVARALGLPRYAWFGYRYEQEADAPDGDRIEVDGAGQVKTSEDASQEDIEELLRTLPRTKKAVPRVAPPSVRPGLKPKRKPIVVKKSAKVKAAKAAKTKAAPKKKAAKPAPKKKKR